MTEDEKEQFTDNIVSQVQEIVNAQTEANKTSWLNFNNDMRTRLEETLPNIVNQIIPKNNYWFPLLSATVNGASVGASIYLAMYLFGA